MMRLVVGSSLQLRYLVIAAAAAMIFFGADQLRNTAVDVFPEFAPPLVEVQTEALGLSTNEVESLVTVPLEEALAGTLGLDVMRSKSVPGLSSVKLIFEPGTDLLAARQLVQERLTNIALPNVSRPPFMIQPLSATSRTMKIGLSSTELSLIELSQINRWKIRRQLMSLPGVANVATWGDRKRQLQVQVDPERLRAYGVTLDQLQLVVSNALGVGLLKYTSGAVVGTGGFIDTPNQRLEVRHVLPVVEPEDLAKVTFEAPDGTILRLSDVTDVVLGHPPMIGDGIINDEVGLLLIVEKFPWANTLQVTRAVEEALETLRPGLPGVEIDSTIFRPATFIEVSIDNLTRALIIGGVLVVVILGLFLYEWRVALISVVAIPLSLIAAGLILHLSGTTINTMVLAGLVIALGAVVDNAIIYVENIVRRLRQHRRAGSDKSTARIILEASLEIRSAIIYATLIIVLAVAPVFAMGGLSGSFFKPLALAYVLALLASMVVALTVTPAMSLILLSSTPLERRDSPIVLWIHRVYDRILSRTVRSPGPALGIVAVFVVAGAIVVPVLGQSLLPDFKERDFLMHWLTKPGTSHPEMNRITIQASRELRNIPGVLNFGAHVGRAVAADEVVGIYFTENWISVDPKADYDETLAAIQSAVEGYPGVVRDVQTYLKERIREVLTGSSEEVDVRIYGPDLEVLRAKAAEVEAALADVEGIADLRTELQVDVAHIEVEVDLSRAAVYGIKPGDVRRAASTLIAGLEVSDIYEGGRLFDVIVWSTPETRADLTALRELLIDTPGGGQIRLIDVADVRIAPTPNVIQRENSSRRIDVGFNTRGRDLGSVVRDVEQRLEEIEFPLEYHPELIGEFAERQAARNRILTFAVASAIAIFFLLHASFSSWRLAVIAFLALPSALVGGLLAAFIGGSVISLGSLVGFLTVLGIAARNGILLISHYQHLEQHEGEAFGPGLVLRGARERVAPILMTAITTGLAIVPLVAFGDIPGHEVEHPMAVVILGGLATSTLLNLFVVPNLYLWFGKRRRKALPAAA